MAEDPPTESPEPGRTRVFLNGVDIELLPDDFSIWYEVPCKPSPDVQL